MTTSLRVGVARRDVTPPLGVHLFGYPAKDRVAESVHDGLNVTALVLEQDGVQAAIVSIDWINVEDSDVETLRTKVHAATGIPPAHVTLCAIQTHSGPATQSCWGWGVKNEEYVQSAIPIIVGAIADAHEAMQPARLGVGTTLSDVGVNRREVTENHTVILGFNPWGPYDPALTVLRFEGDTGPIAIIVHYGAHPTTMGIGREISRDWPGVMVDRLEAATGAVAMFINGAVGDVAPRAFGLGRLPNGPEAARDLGIRAANDALRACASIRDFRDPELELLTSPVSLPHAPLPPLDEARAGLADAEPDKDHWGAPMSAYRYWQAVLEAHERPPAAFRTIMQTITQIGPVTLVPFPGEPFTEIVLRIRHRSPFQHTLCASTTNGVHGYFVTRESRPRGGYEVWVARAFGAYLLADNIDDVLVEENLKLLRRIAAGEQTSAPSIASVPQDSHPAGLFPPGGELPPAKKTRAAPAKSLPKARIFCDGACSGNPGPGGWGCIIETGRSRRELSGGEERTTNNQMELQALIEGLRAVPAGTPVEIITDSEYVAKGVQSWLKGWIRNGWISSTKQPVKNKDRWQEIEFLLQSRPHTVEWVRGHAGHPENERCDELARHAVPRTARSRR